MTATVTVAIMQVHSVVIMMRLLPRRSHSGYDVGGGRCGRVGRESVSEPEGGRSGTARGSGGVMPTEAAPLLSQHRKNNLSHRSCIASTNGRSCGTSSRCGSSWHGRRRGCHLRVLAATEHAADGLCDG